MNLLTFQFKETPNVGESIDFSLLVYDQKLNLSVNKITRQPAIKEIQLGTETYTRSGEVSDSDCNRSDIGILMATQTATKTSGEGLDSDDGKGRVLLMETASMTFIDRDK